jgi:hypothetical protein
MYNVKTLDTGEHLRRLRESQLYTPIHTGNFISSLLLQTDNKCLCADVFSTTSLLHDAFDLDQLVFFYSNPV